MNIFERWWQDPQASSTIVIAVVAGAFAIYQLRAVPADRRRRILDAMIARFEESAGERARVLKGTPPLLALAYEALRAELDASWVIAAPGSQMLSNEELRGTPSAQTLVRLRRELADWSTPDLGVSYFSAAEVFECETKFRALLWAVETIRSNDPSSPVQASNVSSVNALVSKLNTFLSDYESGVFSARQMLGLWHVSLARLSTACLPFIWERSLPRKLMGVDGNPGGGRWGRSVLRAGIAAEHYNDVVRIHRVSPIVWDPKENRQGLAPTIVHPRLTREMLGAEELVVGVPGVPKLLPYLRLWVRDRYWRLVGALTLRPRWSWVTFGGRRLANHISREGELATVLRYAVHCGETRAIDRFSLDLTWTLEGLKREVVAVRTSQPASRPTNRKLRWLYLTQPARQDD